MVKEKKKATITVPATVCHMHSFLSTYSMPSTVQGGGAHEQDGQGLALVGFRDSGVTGYSRRDYCEY